MQKMKQIRVQVFFLWLIIAPIISLSQQSFTGIPIKDLSNKTTYLPINDSISYYVLILISPECPLCKNYTKVLGELNRAYNKQVSFFGIIPGTSYTARSVKSFCKEYKIEFPMYIDDQFTLTKAIGANVTPEVFLINKNNEIIYQGLIDNWMVKLGVNRVAATEHYLEEMIKAAISGQATVFPKQTKAIGCRINDI